MPLTNHSNLPDSVVNLAKSTSYEARGDISVTRLIKPPRIVTLYERHKDEIEIDVQEQAWSILGSAVHYMLQHSAGEGVKVEKRLHTEILGWDVNGQPDIYYPARKRLEDYKVTGTFTFQGSYKKEWEAQLNLNAMLHRLHGEEVEEVAIIAFLRDWMKMKARHDWKYPQHQIYVTGFPLWTQDEAKDYAEQRVYEHQMARELDDDKLPLCTPEERWYESGGWRVYKDGNKKADKVLQSEDEANRYIASNTPSLKKGRKFLPPIEKKGENKRCLYYCEARSVCNFAKSLTPEPLVNETDENE